ncbi:hypothetical protein HRG84_23225 [Flavisolibacter sp. BT320]|nr:hypothetical protein [Flavisolibacter longurius]
MKTVRLIVALLMVPAIFGACKKQVSDMVDAEEKKLAGKYTVSNYRVTVYDSTGRELSKTNNPDFGSVELIMNSNEGGDVFSHFVFYGPVRNSYVPSKVNNSNFCGDQDPAQEKFGAFYQCDPANKRILVAAICPMQTLTYYVDYTLDGKEFEMFTRVVDPTTKAQTLYEYFFTRK